jgi:Secreted repeat of unknown function
VPLNPVALWATKRSQVLAQRAWLDRRQRRWSTASRALRALVLCVEHAFPLNPSLWRPEFHGEPLRGTFSHPLDDIVVIYNSARKTLSANSKRPLQNGLDRRLWGLQRGAIDAAGGVARSGLGKKMWAYKGKPLYTFKKDTAPGETNGDGFLNGARHMAKP